MGSILAASFIMSVVLVLFVVVSVLLILIVLIQKGRGGGLSGAFGGGAGTGRLLGSKTGDFLTWVTVGMAVLFLFFAVLLAKFYKPTDIQPDQQIIPENPLPPEDVEDTNQL